MKDSWVWDLYWFHLFYMAVSRLNSPFPWLLWVISPVCLPPLVLVWPPPQAPAYLINLGPQCPLFMFWVLVILDSLQFPEWTVICLHSFAHAFPSAWNVLPFPCQLGRELLPFRNHPKYFICEASLNQSSLPLQAFTRLYYHLCVGIVFLLDHELLEDLAIVNIYHFW